MLDSGIHECSPAEHPLLHLQPQPVVLQAMEPIQLHARCLSHTSIINNPTHSHRAFHASACRSAHQADLQLQIKMEAAVSDWLRLPQQASWFGAQGAAGAVAGLLLVSAAPVAAAPGPIVEKPLQQQRIPSHCRLRECHPMCPAFLIPPVTIGGKQC